MKIGTPLLTMLASLLLFTGSSRVGQGTYLEIMAAGARSEKEAELHIRMQEMRSVLVVLKAFHYCLVLSKEVLMSDNLRVMTYLTTLRMGI